MRNTSDHKRVPGKTGAWDSYPKQHGEPTNPSERSLQILGKEDTNPKEGAYASLQICVSNIHPVMLIHNRTRASTCLSIKEWFRNTFCTLQIGQSQLLMSQSQISSSYYSCQSPTSQNLLIIKSILQPYPLTDFLGMVTKGPVTSSAHIRQAAELMRFYLHSTSSLLSYNPSFSAFMSNSVQKYYDIVYVWIIRQCREKSISMF